MNRNVEIKAKVDDLAAVRAEAKRLADEGFVMMKQEDTFFHCVRGRLKLRQLAGSVEGELIYYERPDAAGPRESRYLVHRTSDPHGLYAALSAALGIVGVVRKRRTVHLIGPTRVHLDEVEGLGDFVELEVVLQPDQDVSDGAATARDLMQKLGITPAQLIDKAYIDLLDA
ncbi:MAG: class IV adenylate cyclase [Sedimentisphaerales bacterium]|nr:class IV adenylate cyclase [Sedimentisphaerales bacterium]